MTLPDISRWPIPLHQGDYALVISRGDDIAPHILVYEIERDFLSAPRHFAVLNIVARDSRAIDINPEPSTAAIDCQWLADDDFGDDQQSWQWSQGDDGLQWICHQCDWVTTVNAADARQALVSLFTAVG